MTTTADVKLLAEWFWVDRWTGSTAYLLPLEARGLYREMLTQAWRRGARLPLDEATIRRAVAATEAEWARAWPAIAPYWHERDGTLINDTQVEIYTEAQLRQQAASERGIKGAQARWRANGRG